MLNYLFNLAKAGSFIGEGNFNSPFIRHTDIVINVRIEAGALPTYIVFVVQPTYIIFVVQPTYIVFVVQPTYIIFVVQPSYIYIFVVQPSYIYIFVVLLVTLSLSGIISIAVENHCMRQKYSIDIFFLLFSTRSNLHFLFSGYCATDFLKFY